MCEYTIHYYGIEVRNALCEYTNHYYGMEVRHAMCVYLLFITVGWKPAMLCVNNLYSLLWDGSLQCSV